MEALIRKDGNFARIHSSFTRFLGALLLTVFLMFLAAIGINHAKVISQDSGAFFNLFVESQEQKLPYTFKVADKLVGSGVMKLTIEENKLSGVASGLGMILGCNVDFQSRINGTLDGNNGGIDVIVAGEGKPLGILLSSKVTFRGPLKGSLNGEKLDLLGKVSIKGKLARFSGFNSTEDLLIEIPSSALTYELASL